MTDRKILSGDMDEIMRALESGIKDFMDSDRYRTYLRAVSRFHEYSTNNVMLIALQRPDATLVAGFNTWKKLNRSVKKGEKGIRIIAPMPFTVEKEQDRTDGYGNVYKEKIKVTVPRFRAVTIFDIAQTEGEPLPDIAPVDLSGDVRDYEIFLESLRQASEVPVYFEEIKGDARGFFHAVDGSIHIKKDMSQPQTVKTLIHEMAHSVLHNRENGGALLDAATKEVQAESVAFSVCSHFGIDTSEYTFPYVTAWSGKKDLAALRDSMDTIKSTASALIDNIEYRYEQLRREAQPERETQERERKGEAR